MADNKITLGEYASQNWYGGGAEESEVAARQRRSFDENEDWEKVGRRLSTLVFVAGLGVGLYLLVGRTIFKKRVQGRPLDRRGEEQRAVDVDVDDVEPSGLLGT